MIQVVCGNCGSAMYAERATRDFGSDLMRDNVLVRKWKHIPEQGSNSSESSKVCPTIVVTTERDINS